MKVIGTGAPRMLTIRVEPCEVDVLREELSEQRAVLTDGATHARSSGAVAGDRKLEDFHNELVLVCRLLDDLRVIAPRDEPREIVGATWVLDPVIRGAAAFAVERLLDAVKAFNADTGSPTPEELAAALEAAGASVTTLIGLDHAQNYAVE